MQWEIVVRRRVVYGGKKYVITLPVSLNEFLKKLHEVGYGLEARIALKPVPASDVVWLKEVDTDEWFTIKKPPVVINRYEEIASANILGVGVLANPPGGGDCGGGGEALFTLRNVGDTGWYHIRAVSRNYAIQGFFKELTIAACGDTERQTLAEAFEKAASWLREIWKY